MEDFTVSQNIEFAKKSLKERYSEPSMEIKDTFSNMLDIEKYKNQNVNTLSRGERRKLEIWITLIAEFDIIFLDEPFSALDLSSRKSALEIVKMLKETGKSIIICEHMISENLYELADKILFLNEAKINEYANKNEFINNSIPC